MKRFWPVDPNWITIGILILISIGLIVWDLVLAHLRNKYGVYPMGLMGEKTETISQKLLRWAIYHPILPFLAGAFAGHLFWFQSIGKLPPPGNP